MEPQLLLLVLLGAAGVGIVATLVILRRQRNEEDARESPIAASGEGVKLCPSCATENLWTESRCVRCGKHLPDVQRRSW